MLPRSWLLLSIISVFGLIIAACEVGDETGEDSAAAPTVEMSDGDSNDFELTPGPDPTSTPEPEPSPTLEPTSTPEPRVQLNGTLTIADSDEARRDVLEVFGVTGNVGSSVRVHVPTQSLLPTEDGAKCWGENHFSDISESTRIVVRDEAGTILGTASLGPGELEIEVEQDDVNDYFHFRCEFTFSFSPMEEANFYSIEVGRRGALTYSSDELEAMNWTIDLGLGSQ